MRLGDKTFNSKGAAYDYVKMLLYNMILGASVVLGNIIVKS